MAQPKIFISYNRKDRDITQRIVSDLNKAGAEVWVDTDGIQSGNFMQAIDQALIKCNWMVLVLSPNALDSKAVVEEVYSALRRVQQGYMKAVIPILVAPCVPGSIPPQWDVLQRYDATQDYAAALAGVVRAVGLSPVAEHTTEEQFRRVVKDVLQSQQELFELLHSVAPTLPRQYPQALADLGFIAYTDNGIEYILPPLCQVPAGTFLMGSKSIHDKGAQEKEKPQQIVTLPAYQIGRFPVTVAEYACFVHQGHRELFDWREQAGRIDHPATYVSLSDAVAYANWLTGLTGELWELPTEAEWEKAARGANGHIYPWGDTFDERRCNVRESGIFATTSVGRYPSGASPYGVEDMAGNVCEWTRSRYLPYPYRRETEQKDFGSPDDRVVRGGSWDDDAVRVRSAFRDHMWPGELSDHLGFRLVRAAPNS